MLFYDMPRVVLIVLDGVGVGALPDAGEYGDEGADTLRNLARVAGGLRLPMLAALGLGNLGGIEGLGETPSPFASVGTMRELSKGKDTATGHWEMMGVVNETPFPTYPDGFPSELVKEFERRVRKRVIGNRAASGTEIIKELGSEHMKTGALILYTSADSVFQIAAHEAVISPEELYSICRIARTMLRRPPHNVQRVIARPFIGPPFARTPRRKDFALPPPRRTVLDHLVKAGVQVVSIGKVADMFAGKGFTSHTIKSSGNRETMQKLISTFCKLNDGLVYCTLIDFDTLYGHRNDTIGFKKALQEFDPMVAWLMTALEDGDHMIITADHGCDPTMPGTDHTREYVPLIHYNSLTAPRAYGTREGFSDIGATVAQVFGVDVPGTRGKSLLEG